MSKIDEVEDRLARRLVALRGHRKLSQEKLARITGLQQPAISKIERGDRRVTAGELVVLSEALKVDLEALVGPGELTIVTVR